MGGEVSRWGSDAANKYYTVVGGSVFQLDDAISKSNPVSQVIVDARALNTTAKDLGKSAPSMSLAQFKAASYAGGALDFKPQLKATYGNALWNAGDRTLVHNDKVGNAAWAYFGAQRMGLPTWMLKAGGEYQARKQTGKRDDPLDQQFIERGASIK